MTTEDRLAAIHATFQDEVERLARNGGQVILPELAVHSPDGNWTFEDVEVSRTTCGATSCSRAWSPRSTC